MPSPLASLSALCEHFLSVIYPIQLFVSVLVLVSVVVPASPAPCVCDNAKSFDVLGNA